MPQPQERQPPAGSQLTAALPFFVFPSGELDDRWLIEEHDHRLPKFGPSNWLSAENLTDYGLIHPSKPGYRLVRIAQADDKPGWYRWLWANERTNQELYNGGKKFSGESNAHPIFLRSYVTLRERYEIDGPATKGSALTALIGLKRTSDGTTSLEDGIYDLTISGGGGSGATGKFEIINGRIVAQWLTNVGTGYTSAPSVSIPNVLNGTIVAILQPTSAKLVKEESEPAGAELSSLFVNVTRIYETLPGPELIGQYFDFNLGQRVDVYNQVVAYGATAEHGVGVVASSIQTRDSVAAMRHVEKAVSTSVPTGFTRDLKWETEQDEETNTDIYKIEAYVDAGTALPALNSQIDVGGQTGLYVIYRKRFKYSDSEDRWLIMACALPAAYVRYPSAGIRWPGIFTWLAQFNVPFTFPYTPPFPGVHYNYLPPRTNKQVARETHYFTVGKPASVPKKFTVLSPGTASKMVPIHEDTVHPAVDWYVTTDEFGTVLVEHLPESDPPTFDPNALYVMDATARRWKGEIWEVIVVEASEGKSVTYHPPAQQGTGFTIGEFADGLELADFANSGFYAVNTDAGANAVRLFGFRGPAWMKISGTTPVDAGLVNLGEGVLNTVEFITGDGISQSNTTAIYAYGTAGTATITFSSNPSNDDQIKLGFLNGTAIYNTTYTFKTTLSENIKPTGTLTLAGNAGNGETVTIGPAGDTQTWTFKTTLSENVKASATFVVNVAAAGPSDGETITVGNRIYTFKDPLVSLPNNVYSGASMSDAMDNLSAAINAGAGSGTAYGAGTTAHTQVSATSPSDDLIVSALLGGTAANSIAVSASAGLSGYGAWAATTLLGGLDTAVNEVKIGATASDSIDNLIAAINAAAGAGSLYSTGTTASEYVTAAAGAGDTMVATSILGGTSANSITTTEALLTFGSQWGAATLSGGTAAVALQVQRGSTAAESARNLQRAINSSGTAGTHYSTGTTADAIIEVPAEVDAAVFTVATRIPADWESFGSWQTGGAFNWITDATGAFPVTDFGTVADITGAANGELIGTLATANHSLVCNLQDFDDQQLKTRNVPPTPDDLTTTAVLVGNRNATIFFGQYGRMPLKYQKSVDGVTNWIDGTTSLNSFSQDGQINKVGITDFAGVSTYRYIRFVISPATRNPGTSDYGTGNVSRMYLQVAWVI